jgi:hypothetical protein
MEANFRWTRTPFQSLEKDVIGLDKEIAIATPIPPAFWLFGSGLVGLIGIVRRKKVV